MYLLFPVTLLDYEIPIESVPEPLLRVIHAGAAIRLCIPKSPLGRIGSLHSCMERCYNYRYKPCSSYCQCDDLCTAYGDCCYDYEHACVKDHGINNTSTSDYDSQIETKNCWNKVMSRNMLKSESDLSCIQPSPFSEWYLLRANCAISAPTSHLCVQPSSDSDLLSRIPVFGSDNVHYRNVFCALCNDLTYNAIQFWNLTYKNCSDITQKAYEDQTIASEKCNLELIFDSASGNMPRVCANSFSSKCSDSRQILVDACKRYSAPITIDGILYKNPHCAECNGWNTSFIYPCLNNHIKNCNGVGADDKYDDTLSTSELPSKGPTFSIFFDFRNNHIGVAGQITSLDFQSCQEGKTFDPFLGQCRH